MPREVRITTPKRLMGSGPKKELKMPGTVPLPIVPSVAADSPLREAMKPPLLLITAQMTATMPNSMMMPWMKSFTAVAM